MATSGVVSKEVKPRSYAISTSNGTVRRNRSALIPNRQMKTDRPTGAEVQGSHLANPASHVEARSNRRTRTDRPTGAEVHGSLSATPASHVEAQSSVNTGAEVHGSPLATPASQPVNTATNPGGADGTGPGAKSDAVTQPRPDAVPEPLAVSRPRRERRMPARFEPYVLT